VRQERPCPDNKKDVGSFDLKRDKPSPPKTAETKREAHAVISEGFDEEDESSAFMAYVDNQISDDHWYLDGGATDHMTDRVEWFSTMTEIPRGR
jgi:hypothetical protein